MDDFKRQYGLTNCEIAQKLDSLGDDDFLEVFVEFAKLNNKWDESDLERTRNFLRLDMHCNE
jgi:hypothetical protein